MIVGSDFSEEMIKKAIINANGRNDAKFVVMDSNSILFPQSFFDIVCARHTPFNSEEVYRVLSDKGTLISEQVDENDCYELKKIFGRGQGFNTEIKQIDKDKESLKKAKFAEIKFYQIIQEEFYKTEEDLLFLLNNTPILPEFGKVEQDFEKFNYYVKNNTSKKGIYLKRELYGIIAKK